MLFADGHAASLRENPGGWGPWRIRKSDLEVDWDEDGEFNTAMAINTWCFAENGRFSNDSTVSINASTGESPLATSRVDSTGYGKSDRNEWYRIDGHVLQLVYDNG